MLFRRLLAFCVFILGAGTVFGAMPLKVMTFNLRFASDRPPNSWPERRPVMKHCLEKADADIVGTQEGLYQQLKDIQSDLPRYHWIGLGRGGGSKGEFMAIFYKYEQFEPVEFDHFWLSDTPEVIASSTWGNSNRRMVTWARFKRRSDRGEFYIVNTHFDHQVQLAREKSAELLRERIGKFPLAIPIIVAGDFNAIAGENKAYETLVRDGFLIDTWNAAQETRGELVNTFHGFRGPAKGGHRIDWILARGVESRWTEILTCSKNGQYPSDHFPVIAELLLK